LKNSQKFTVSNELQETKSYWETALETMETGVETSSRGCAIGDADLISQGTSSIKKGTEYLMLTTRALKIALA
jgi:hypothetical protein